VLFQAGNSEAGRAFAVENAEATFIPAATPEAARRDIKILEDLARNRGKDPHALKKLVTFSSVIGSTEEEAKRKQQYLFDHIDYEALQAFFTGVSGVDYFSIPAGTKLGTLRNQVETSEHVRSGFQSVLDVNPELSDDSTWADAIVRTLALPGRFAGTPEQIADHIEEYAQAGVDGFNVVPVQALGGWWDEGVDQVVPVLQKRGLAQKEYTPGTLRKKLTGSDRISPDHRARKVTLDENPAGVEA
jgi:alkanesulfonate monooxygenase SsuD/methylene tetrahydromethanopterin reductase-like flavin-dependent oxidoreductase (luciferase family)